MKQGFDSPTGYIIFAAFLAIARICGGFVSGPLTNSWPFFDISFYFNHYTS